MDDRTPRLRAALAFVTAGAACAPAAAVQAGAGARGDLDEWTSLDEEVELLTRSLEERPLVEVDAYVKFSYRRSDDLVYTRDPVTFEDLGDLGGFMFDSTGISIEAERGIAKGKLGYNPASERLRSTYVALEPVPFATITMGRFKAPFLRSRLVSTKKLLFIDRSIQARQTGPRDEGLKVELELGNRVDLIVSAQNGADGLGEEGYYVGRLEVEVLGKGVRSYEGAYDAREGTALTLGLAVARDETLDDGQYEAVDVALTHGRLSLSGEALHYPSDAAEFLGQDRIYDLGIIDPVSRITWTDTDPWAVAASWLLVEDTWEAAVRLEELDDVNDTSRLTIGLNHYVEGHDLKWQLNFIEVRTDNELLESEVLALGLVFRF